MESVESDFVGVWDKFPVSKHSDITMVGLDGTGKTTILYKMKVDKLLTVIPTIGFNVDSVQLCEDLTLTIWDFGGQEKIRKLWNDFEHDKRAEGLIFVVDSSDEERFPEAKEELHRVLKFESLLHVPILVLASKQDLPNAKSATAIAEALDLVALSAAHEYHIQECSAITGDGLNEGFACFASLLRKHKESG